MTDRELLEEIRETVADLRAALPMIQRDTQELRSTVYGNGGVGLKASVADIKRNCDDRCPRGLWAFFRPCAQNIITWIVLGALALIGYLCAVAHQLQAKP